MRVPVAAAALLAAAISLTAARTADAQHTVDFAVERYQPSAMPDSLFQLETSSVLPVRSLSLGVASSYAHRPLVLRDRITKQDLLVPVKARVGVDLLAAYGVTRRISLGLAVPVVVYQSGDRVQGINVNDEESLAGTVLGDPRLELKAQLGRLRDFKPRAAFGVIVSVPLGDESQFGGEAGVVIEPRVMVDFQRPRYAFAVNAGARLRLEESEFFDEPIRNELVFGAGGRWAFRHSGIGRRAWVTGEIIGVVEAEGGPRPWEFRGGVRIPWTGQVDVGFGVGVGFGAEIGAPTLRGLFDVRWGAGRDSDRDGVNDVCDRCVFEAEDVDGVEDGDGCVDPDNDGDGARDWEDECPDVAEDMDGRDDLDGCPDPDDDGDQIPTARDRCPESAEDFDDFQDGDGCPDNDNDGDGISDSIDQCPLEPETTSGAGADGCPDGGASAPAPDPEPAPSP